MSPTANPAPEVIPISRLDAYLAGLEAGDASAVLGSLRADTTLNVAVHAQPFVGLDAIGFVFENLFSGILGDLHVREVLGEGRRRVAVFDVRVAGYEGAAEGLNLITLDDDGELAEVTVFLRPLDALVALSDEIGRRFGGPRPA
jgi:hypothetical protein